MKNIVLTLIATLGLTAFVLSPVSTAMANSAEQSAEQSQTVKVECTSGAYGQNSNCKAEGSQNQKLHQVITYSKVLGAKKIHTPVNTAVDPSMLAVIAITGLTGIGAFVGYARLSR